MNMPSVFKITVPYIMIDLELRSACGSPLQIGVVLVILLILSLFPLLQILHYFCLLSRDKNWSYIV